MVDPIFGFPDFRSGTAEFAQLGPDTKRMMVTGETFNQFEDIARQGIADLMAANQNDTAPMVNLPQMRGGGLAEAIGAALTNIVQPGAAQQFAQQQYAVRRANAQMAAQEELANQTQEGYLQRRKQEREQLAAKLQSDVQEARVKAKQAIEMFGIEAGEKRAQASAEAARKAAEADAMANSKWYADHGSRFEQLRTMIETGVSGVDAAGNPQTLTLAERRSMMDALTRMALTAPTDILKSNMESTIDSLDSLLTGLKNAADAPAPAPVAGPQDTRSTAEKAGSFVRSFPGMARESTSGVVADFIGGLLNIPEDFPGIIPPIEEFVSTRMSNVEIPEEQMMIGPDFKLVRPELPELRRAREQNAPTKR